MGGLEVEVALFSWSLNSVGTLSGVAWKSHLRQNCLDHTTCTSIYLVPWFLGSTIIFGLFVFCLCVALSP